MEKKVTYLNTAKKVKRKKNEQAKESCSKEGEWLK